MVPKKTAFISKRNSFPSMSFFLQGIVNIYFVYIAIIDAQCGNSSWCLGVRTANFDSAESGASIHFRVLLRSNYDYYWSDWTTLDNSDCDDFTINRWDYFPVPCFDLWYGFALENRNTWNDYWAVTAIKYNRTSIDTFENYQGGDRDYYWISPSMYYYFDTNGKIISNDESDIPAPEPPTKNSSNLTIIPTILPTKPPTIFATNTPIVLPSMPPTNMPTILASKKTSIIPTRFPTVAPISQSTHLLTKAPTVFPTNATTKNPTKYPFNKSINPQNSDAVDQSQRTGIIIIIIIGSIIVIVCCSLFIFIAKECLSIKKDLESMTPLNNISKYFYRFCISILFDICTCIYSMYLVNGEIALSTLPCTSDIDIQIKNDKIIASEWQKDMFDFKKYYIRPEEYI